MPFAWLHRQGCFLIPLGIGKVYHIRRQRDDVRHDPTVERPKMQVVFGVLPEPLYHPLSNAHASPVFKRTGFGGALSRVSGHLSCHYPLLR